MHFVPEREQNKIPEVEEDEEDEYANTTIPKFNCLGDDTVTRLSFPKESFVKNMFLKSYDDNGEDNLEFPPYQISHGTLNIPAVANFVFNQSKKNVQILVTCLKTPRKFVHKGKFYEMRKQITDLLHFLRCGKGIVLRQVDDGKRLEGFRKFLNYMFSEKVLNMIYVAVSSRGNDVSFYNLIFYL